MRVATVANFPDGDRRPRRRRARRWRAAVADGADEVDVVAPWRRLACDGDREVAVALVRACRQACGGRAPEGHPRDRLSSPGPDAVRALAADALGAGAHFVKTSTGKVGVGRDAGGGPGDARGDPRRGPPAGFKAAGGVRTAEQAAGYLALADEVLGAGWATPETFRIGASGLVDDLLRAPRRVGRRRCCPRPSCTSTSRAPPAPS